jgi:hypothetical protein
VVTYEECPEKIGRWYTEKEAHINKVVPFENLKYIDCGVELFLTPV